MILSCNRANSAAKKRLKIEVGEIKEISLPGQSDGTAELIGTSDNQEIVEVSRRQLAPAVDTVKRADQGPSVFQIKGVTVGTANVVFTTKPLGSAGAGETIRTYVVQVVAN
ncbi:hypothetical protein GCM10028805_03140 [Spirosoma harenae]